MVKRYSDERLSREFLILHDKVLHELEQRARHILRKNPRHVKEFLMAMGSWFFITPEDENVDEEQYPWMLDPIVRLMDKYDEAFHLTGNPMRFTADGPKITSW